MSNLFHCLEDFRIKSRSRLPQLMFDFIEGAAGSEYAVIKNIETLKQIRLLPRVLVNVQKEA
jgi:L-lactate dehydrogenase (FMN-dependent) and related alpha-hydroxy acid dehydrogenases